MLTDLDRAFEDLAKALLAEHPEVRYEWRTVKSPWWGERLDLICGVDTPSEVFASLHGWQIAVGVTSGDHRDFEDFGRDISDKDVAREAFEHFVGLLRKHGHIGSAGV